MGAEDENILGGLVAELSRRLEVLIKRVGKPSPCRGCQKEIYWIRHTNMKWTPYTLEGLNHFVDCPKASDFRRRFHDHG